MSESIPVKIHESAKAKFLLDGMKESLLKRQIDPKFHYINLQQAQDWLFLHRKYSPYATSEKVKKIYADAFQWMAIELAGSQTHLTSIASGDARKEAQLLKELQKTVVVVTATLSDISRPLVCQGYRLLISEKCVSRADAVVLDFLKAPNVAKLLFKRNQRHVKNLVTSFGLMPNTDPLLMVSKLHSFAKKSIVLVGTNLANPNNIKEVLAGYDNTETRRWLFQFFHNCGFDRADGEFVFSIEPCPSMPQLPQVVARFNLHRNKTILFGGNMFHFKASESIKAFFSNRYDEMLLKNLFKMNGFQILGEWISDDKTEGVIACSVTSP